MKIEHGGRWKKGQSGGGHKYKNKKQRKDAEEEIREIIRAFLKRNLKKMLEDVVLPSSDQDSFPTMPGPKKNSKISRTRYEVIWNILPYAVGKLSYQESKIDVKKLSDDQLNALLHKIVNGTESA